MCQQTPAVNQSSRMLTMRDVIAVPGKVEVCFGRSK